MTSTGQVAGAHHAGTILGKRFKVEKVLGRGGFAITYLCRAGTFNKAYAVKEFLPIQLATRETDRTVHPLTEDDREMFERGIKDFLEEGRRLQLCEHKHVVKVEDFFNEYGTAYLVMEYIQGETLSARLKKSGPLAGPDLIRLMMPTLDALAAVHKSGLLHRDLSPSNIMLRGDLDDPVLIDFGASRYSGSLRSYSIAQITNDGFSSPEHYDVKAEHTPATDLHSIGAISYNALTGERPPSAIDRKISDSMGGWGDRFRGLKSKLMVPIIDKAMSLNPKDRHQTVGELQAALAGVRSTWDALEMASRSLLQPSMTVTERSDGTVELRGTAGSAAIAAELVARLQAAIPSVKVRDALEVATSAADAATKMMTSEGATVLAPSKSDMTAPLVAAAAAPPAAAARAALASAGALWASIEGSGAASDPIKIAGLAPNPDDRRNALDQVRRVIAGAPLVDLTEVATSLAGASNPGRDAGFGGGQRVDLGPPPSAGGGGHVVSGGGGTSVPEIEGRGTGKAIGLSLAALIIAAGLGAWSLGYLPFGGSGGTGGTPPPQVVNQGGTIDAGGRPVAQGGTGDPRPVGQVVPPAPVQPDQGGGTRVTSNDQRPPVQPPTSDTKPNAPEVPAGRPDPGPTFRPVENPFNVQIELTKTSYRIGEPLAFVVRAGRECNFLVYTVGPDDKVELHDPKARGAVEFMGAPALSSGEARQIPVPTAPGIARVKGPAGNYQIGAVCSESELAQIGISTTELREPARQGRRSFEFKLEELRQKINRGELSLVTVQYAVTE